MAMVNLDTGERRDLEIEGWRNVGRPAWCATADCVYAVAVRDKKFVLLRIDMEGHVQRILQTDPNIRPTGGVLPSPDGRHLAFGKVHEESAVWLLENY